MAQWRHLLQPVTDRNEPSLETRESTEKAEQTIVKHVVMDQEGLENSPCLRKNKRNLQISPSTPVGLERKQLTMNKQSTVKVITFDQDIEMVDIENYETSAGVVTTTSNIVSASQNMSLQETPNRKFLKALRRRDTVLQDHNLGDNLGPQDSMAKAMDKGSTSKGISIKKLKQRCKEKVKNYKTTRKKKIILEPKQRLIHEFYTRTPVCNIAGLDGDVDFQTKMAENSNNQAGLE